MKYSFLAILLIAFVISGYSQVDNRKIIGYWKYKEVISNADTSREDQLLEMGFSENHQFTMSNQAQTVKGTWKIEDSMLVMKGVNIETKKESIEKIKIYKLTDDTLELEFNSASNKIESAKKLIFVFRRRK